MWKELKRQRVYASGTVTLDELQVTDPNGNSTKRVILSLGGDSVLIIPEIASGELLMCAQHRVNVQEEVLEFPNGGIKKGEDVFVAAIRELNEETGYTGDLEYIGSFVPLSGLVDLSVHVHVCKNARKAEQVMQPDEYEQIRLAPIKLSDLKEKIRASKVTDGYALAALQLYATWNEEVSYGKEYKRK